MSSAERAGPGYGQELILKLSKELGGRFGRGFSRWNLEQMRAFYLWRPIAQTVSAELIAQHLPLPWSHYSRLLTVRDDDARAFYEREAVRGGWSFRQLDRQIASLAYQRSGGRASGVTGEPVSVEEVIRDPFVLEFLQLRDEYSESDLEGALITELEKFLLEPRQRLCLRGSSTEIAGRR